MFSKLDIDKMKTHAINRGGKCLSKIYINSKTKLEWQCYFGHKFLQTYDSSRRSWCPICKQSLSERICREVFEILFNKSFPKTKPSWLKGLELDGFCQELKLAFEHNGEQHYRKTKQFKINNSLLRLIKKRDSDKQKLCTQNGVTLVVIPQLFVLTKNVNDIKKLIKNSGFKPLPKNFDQKLIKISDAYKSNRAIERLQILKSEANSIGYILLSTTYMNCKEKLSFKCKLHSMTFSATADAILNSKNSARCPMCIKSKRSRSRKYSINYFKNLAKSRSAICLSKEYYHKIPLVMKCLICKHTWNVHVSNIKNNWCPTCAHYRARKLSVKQDKKILKLKNNGATISELARMFNVSRGCIYAALTRMSFDS